MKKELTLSDLQNVKGGLDAAASKSRDEAYNKKHKAEVECDCSKSTTAAPSEF